MSDPVAIPGRVLSGHLAAPADCFFPRPLGGEGQGEGVAEPTPNVLSHPTPVSQVTVAILAGGMGTRLRGVVADRPKVLAEVAGRPFLGWLLARLESQGFRRVVLCTGHQAEQIETEFGAHHGTLELVYSRETTALGTGGALRQALPLFDDGWVLALNGDSFCDVDLAAFVDWHAQNRHLASLVLTQVADTRRYGRVNTRADGHVVEFAEKSGTSGLGWINAGIYLLPTGLLAGVIPEAFVSLERELLPRWLALGLQGYRRAGRFIDIGTPESYREADAFFADIGEEVAA